MKDLTNSDINRYLSKGELKLKHNGYTLIKGKSLKQFKLEFGHLMSEATKTTVLGLFNFRAHVSLEMLLFESEKAKSLRSKILDIAHLDIASKQLFYKLINYPKVDIGVLNKIYS